MKFLNIVLVLSIGITIGIWTPVGINLLIGKSDDHPKNNIQATFEPIVPFGHRKLMWMRGLHKVEFKHDDDGSMLVGFVPVDLYLEIEQEYADQGVVVLFDGTFTIICTMQIIDTNEPTINTMNN